MIFSTAPSAWAGNPSTTATLSVSSGGTPVTTVTAGTVITLKATVKAGISAVTPGLVNFCDASATYCTDIHIIGTAQLTSNGTATIKFRPGVGSHSYKAVFVGTKVYSSSTSASSSLTVTSTHTGTYPTNAIMSASGVAGNYSLTANVGAVTDATETNFPTGTVSFLDTNTGNTVLGTAVLSSSKASLTFLNKNPISPSSAQPAAIGDFNGDGIPDIAEAIPQDVPLNGYVNIWLGNGDGTFTLSSSTPTVGENPVAIATGDFNGDGIADLAVVNQYNNTVSILLGNGDGTFASGATLGLGSRPFAIAVADFNGDGNTDLAVINGDMLTVFLGDGKGNFTAMGTSPSSGCGSLSIAVGDFNGDGNQDVAVAASCAGVTILLGNGDGTFTTAVNPVTGANFNSVVAGDFNGDGKIDLAVLNLTGFVDALLGKGDGTFAFSSRSSTLTAPDYLVMGDFNGDGVPDLAVSAPNELPLTILVGNEDGTFTSTAEGPVAGGELAVGDFNGDGRADIAVTANSSVSALLSEPQASIATATGISPYGTGTDNVVASYPGDSNFGSSTSGSVALTDANVQATLSSTSLSFGSEPDGYSTGAQNVTLTNGGTVALSISSIKLNGTNPTQFASSNTCGTSLAAGSSCRIGTRFAPTILGPLSATVTLTDNGPGSPQTISLSGTGTTVPAGSLSLSSTTFAFGNEGANGSSGAMNSTVTNTGGTTVYFNSIVLGGTNSSLFVTSNTCGASLAAGSTCNIGARFVPKAAGTFSASITLTDSASTSPQTITLTGTGIGAVVSLSPAGLPFGNWPSGYSTGIQSVTLQNTGYLDLTINSIRLGGSNAADFSTSNKCPASLVPRGSCWINVRFIPVTTSPFSATIMLTDNATDSPQQITLSGTGIAAPSTTLSLSSNSLGFGSQTVGTSSPSQNVTVTNTGSATLYFKSITLGGTNASSFVTSNTCGASIAAGAKCNIGARFVPQATGPLSATITITDSATGSPQTISLGGTGE